MCWLAAKKRLRAKDTLLSLGLVMDDLCPLCDIYPETTKHFFIESPFSMRCVPAVRGLVGVVFCPMDKMDFRKSKLTCFQRRVLCAVYAVVMNRNAAVWKCFVNTPQQLLCII